VKETVSGMGGSADESGLSFGGGLGLRVGDALSAEFEYAQLDEDIWFLSGGAIFSF